MVATSTLPKTRAKEAGNGVEVEVLAPKSGVGIWVDSLMIPRDAQNVANAHKYINHTLNPETAAKNGNYCDLCSGQPSGA